MTEFIFDNEVNRAVMDLRDYIDCNRATTLLLEEGFGKLHLQVRCVKDDVLLLTEEQVKEIKLNNILQIQTDTR